MDSTLISDLDYYVKFIFSTVDGSFCFSTVDRDELDNVLSAYDSSICSGFQVGDEIKFNGQKDHYLIKDIHVRQLAKHLDTLSYGVDLNGCISTSGRQKDPLFSILFTIDKLENI